MSINSNNITSGIAPSRLATYANTYANMATAPPLLYSGEAPVEAGAEIYFSSWETGLSKFVAIPTSDSRGRTRILISPVEYEQVLRNVKALAYITTCSRFGGLIRFGFLMGGDIDYTVPEALALAARAFAEGDDEELNDLERSLEELLEQVRLLRASR